MGLSGDKTHRRPFSMARRLMGFAAAQPILQTPIFARPLNRAVTGLFVE